MKKESNNRTKWLHLRLTTDEYNLLRERFEKSTCHGLSDFARKNLLGKPIIKKYRNESLDEMILEFIELRNGLNGIGNNFNQVVKKLHTLHQIHEFKVWITAYEVDKEVLFNSIENIKTHIQKLSEKWLQS